MNRDQAMFASALDEAFSQKIKAVMRTNSESSACSPEHRRFMDELVGARERQRTRRYILWERVLVAALVAAMLLALGFRDGEPWERVGAFMVKYEDGNVDINYATPVKDMSCQYRYQPTYMPQGFVFVGQVDKDGKNIMTWKNAAGDRIVFTDVFDSQFSSLRDTARTDFTEFSYGDMTAYCHVTPNEHCHVWNDGLHACQIEAPATVSEEEMLDIMQGLEQVEP